MELVIWFSLGLLLTILSHYLEYKTTGESKVEWLSFIFIICPILPFFICIVIVINKLENVGPLFVFRKNNNEGEN